MDEWQRAQLSEVVALIRIVVFELAVIIGLLFGIYVTGGEQCRPPK